MIQLEGVFYGFCDLRYIEGKNIPISFWIRKGGKEVGEVLGQMPFQLPIDILKTRTGALEDCPKEGRRASACITNVDVFLVFEVSRGLWHNFTCFKQK